MFQRATSYARASLSSPSGSQPRFSLGLSSSSAAQPPDRPSAITEKRDRQTASKGPCPSSFRGPLGLSSSGDSTRHQPVLPALGTLSPACYLQPLYDLFAHNSPLTLLPPLRTSILLFDSARRPSNTHYHLTLGPAATPLRNHESRVVSMPFMAVAPLIRCRCICHTENEHH
jgi:hypothetical protein